MIVVDASCLLEMLLQASKSQAVEKRLLGDDGPLCIPHLADIEVTHVLRRYWLAKEITERYGSSAIADLTDFPLERFPHVELLPRIWQLRKNLTAYDAVYVALAEALEVPLITCDRKLAQATGNRAKIEAI